MSRLPETSWAAGVHESSTGPPTGGTVCSGPTQAARRSCAPFLRTAYVTIRPNSVPPSS